MPNPPPARALLIANTKSRRGREGIGPARDVLEAHGFTLIDGQCESSEDLSPMIVERVGEVDCVIVAGGDGTLNAAARGMMAVNLPLGILPMGTANDLARTLGIPPDIEAAARVIAARLEKRIDVGEVNGHPFFNVASIGISAELARALTPEKKRRFGRLAYALTAIEVLLRARPFRALLVTKDGGRRITTFQVAVGNGRYYGGGMAVASDARIDDSALDLYSLEVAGVWKLALMLRSFRSGLHGLWEEVRTERCDSFDIRTRKPRPVNTDGELVTFTPARFTVLPKAIRVFVPA